MQPDNHEVFQSDSQVELKSSRFAGKSAIVKSFGLVGFLITFILGLQAISSPDSQLLAIVLMASSLSYAIALLLLIVQKSESSYRVASSLVIISLSILSIYLIYSGGKDNTGALWIYLLAPVVFFIGGLKMGLILLGIFLAITCWMLFSGDPNLLAAEYSSVFKSRLILSFCTLSFLAAVYEAVRQRSYHQIQQLSNQFELQARHDSLTKLLNRRGMRERMEQAYNRANENNEPLSILLADVDYFKDINDKYGHATGDYVLTYLARLLKASVRKCDWTARWGGEEFLLLLPDTDLNDAASIAEQLREAIDNTLISHNGHMIKVSICFGVTSMGADSTIDAAINRADQQLYRAKNQGRNQVKSAR